MTIEVRTPLNVKTNDETVESTAVNTEDFGDPHVDHGRGSSDESEDFIVVESNVVIVVGVEGDLAVGNGESGHEGGRIGVGFWLGEQ